MSYVIMYILAIYIKRSQIWVNRKQNFAIGFIINL